MLRKLAACILLIACGVTFGAGIALRCHGFQFPGEALLGLLLGMGGFTVSLVFDGPKKEP